MINSDSDLDDVMDARLDWALGELGGHAVPPDVTERVLRRCAELRWANPSPDEIAPDVESGPASEWHRAPTTRRQRWLVAALLIATLTAVTWTAILAPPEGATAAAQDPEAPAWTSVRSRADIDALPAGVTHVVGINLGDDDVAALAARGGLRGLILRAEWWPKLGVAPRFLTASALPHLAEMSELRELDLYWQSELAGVPLDALAGLPLLVTLKLDRFDVADRHLSFLAELPSLRELVLTGNHGFSQAGVEAIAACPDLRRLDLAWCSQLGARDLAPLAGLRRLEALDLQDLGRGHRGVIGDDTLRDLQLRHRIKGWRDSPFNDTVVEAVAALPLSLRWLRLSGTTVDDDALRALRKRCSGLRQIELSQCAQITDVGVAELLALRELHRLDVSGCPGLSRFGLDLIAQSKQVRQVRLDDLDWLTAAQAEALFAAGIDVELTDAENPLYTSLPGWRREYPLRGR